MTSENDDIGKAEKETEETLERSREKSDALGKAIEAAEHKRPAKPDHANDGGVF